MHFLQDRELGDVIFNFCKCTKVLYQGYVNCVNAQVESVTQHLLLKSVLDLATENFMEDLQKSFSQLIGGRK